MTDAGRNIVNKDDKKPVSSPKISIIIPAYNAARYIETTLANLFSQTYTGFEIIVAYDEKSTDNTLEILEKEAQTHNNLIIDIGRDTSSGTARNRGFARARGTYILFADADDEIHPQYLETLITLFDEHPGFDVVCCDYVKVFENTIEQGWKTAHATDTAKTEILTRKEALYKLLFEEIANTPWIFLAKKDYLEKNNIRFPDYSYGDDSCYAHQLFANTEKIARSLKKRYIFILHETSITHTITPENWWQRYEKSRTDITAYFKERDPVYACDYMTAMTRKYVYTAVLLYDYPQFKTEMEKCGIKKIGMLRRHDKFANKMSVICYAVSKKLFYKLARAAAAHMENLTPMGKKLET
ncbi:MAG TPA: glycosyltransferase family 2 protein [Methanocorpusculum sp.]|nr:glycosyltransferase family 2 protein [Methanocorpusculum sp.]